MNKKINMKNWEGYGKFYVRVSMKKTDIEEDTREYDANGFTQNVRLRKQFLSKNSKNSPWSSFSSFERLLPHHTLIKHNL